MSHPRKVWIVFAAALVVVVAAMGYLSAVAVRLDDERAEARRARREVVAEARRARREVEAKARREAELEESVRLSLWRMDGALTATVAQESTRPFFEYSPFYKPNDACTSAYVPVAPGSVILPSPLLWQDPPLVLLHFAIASDGTVSSPQVVPKPTDNPATSGRLSTARAARAAQRLKDLKAVLARADLASVLPAPPTAPAQAEPNVAIAALGNKTTGLLRQGQAALNGNEFNARNYNNAVANSQSFQYAQNRDLVSARTLREGAARSIWLGKNLLLARRVARGNETHVVGCWLDWAAMRPWLLGYVHDLLPEAQLVAVSSNGQADYDRRLVSLPLRLVPGPVPVSPLVAAAPPLVAAVSPDDLSTLVASLGAAWAGVLLAAGAVAAMLHGVLSLSQRRAVFATAVTHELRTPLTSMRMYTEMLADGTVTDDDKRADYLNTLHAQTGRMCHLVENVLEYAQIESGQAAAVAATDVTAGQLLDRARPRLDQRAEQAGMELLFEVGHDAAGAMLHVDPTAVEQVLFNLVDNACKYACGAADKRIHLEVRAGGGLVELSVRDHGPGIPAGDAGRIFHPFTKARRDQAGTSGGVGLGLAIGRTATRRMGGRLVCRPAGDQGACFVLSLPRKR